MMSETLLYSGKAKDLFSTDDPEVLKMIYKDQATALNGKRKEQITGKGEVNYEISKLIFAYLSQQGIETHLIKMYLKPNNSSKKSPLSRWKWS